MRRVLVMSVTLEDRDVARLIVELLADEGAAGPVVFWESGDVAPRDR